MNYKIEKGKLLPDMGRQPTPIEFPFSQMRIGDSFFVKAEDHTAYVRMYGKLMNQAKKFRKLTNDRQFSVSTRTEPSGFRVWRMT